MLKDCKLLAALIIVSFACVVATSAETGEAIFKSTCARCHGQDGAAHTPAAERMKVANLRSAYVQNQSDEELLASIGRGVKHKEYPHDFLDRGMTKAQVQSVIAYIRTLRDKQEVRPVRRSQTRSETR